MGSVNIFTTVLALSHRDKIIYIMKSCNCDCECLKVRDYNKCLANEEQNRACLHGDKLRSALFLHSTYSFLTSLTFFAC